MNGYIYYKGYYIVYCVVWSYYVLYLSDLYSFIDMVVYMYNVMMLNVILLKCDWKGYLSSCIYNNYEEIIKIVFFYEVIYLCLFFSKILFNLK